MSWAGGGQQCRTRPGPAVFSNGVLTHQSLQATTRHRRQTRRNHTHHNARVHRRPPAQIARSGLGVLLPEPHITTARSPVELNTEPAFCVSRPRAHMCRYGAPDDGHLPALCARVRCAEVERRSAFLKEWGRVKVSLQVVAWMRVSAGAARDVDVEVCGLWLFRTRVRRSDEGRLGCRAFLR